MKAPSITLFTAALGALALAAPVRAQKPPPTAESLKTSISFRQQRTDVLRDEIKGTNDRLEARLDAIIETLRMIADSKDSGTKVARIKEETGKRLMQTIRYYDQKRAALKEDLRRPRLRLTDAEKRKLIAAFDARIEKRTRQILALNQSMPAHKDHARYRVTHDDDDSDYHRNEDYQQNRRMTSHANSQRDAIIKEFDSSLSRLDRQARTLKTQLGGTADPARRQLLTDEIEKTEALIADRRRQRLETLTAAGRAARPVGLDEAMDLDRALKGAVDDLRREFTALFERYHTWLNELSSLHTAEADLAASTAR